MKNIILGFLIAVVCVFTIAATVPDSIMTFKPAQPKSTITTSGYVEDITKFIHKYSKYGYQVKLVSGSDELHNCWIIVMEKY